eukprot:Pgem_evm1s15365
MLLILGEEDYDNAAYGYVWRPESMDFHKEGQDVPLIFSNKYLEVVSQFNNSTQASSYKPCPDSVNPSTWKQAQLLSNVGVYKVRDGVYQVRG